MFLLLARLVGNCPGLLYTIGELKKHREIILPVGSFEDRPAGPLSLDTIIALLASCRASNKCHVTVAWPLGYGYSPSHRYWAGFEPSLLVKIVESLIESFTSRMNVRRIIIVDGHYGHKMVLREVLNRFVGQVAYINVWDIASELGYTSFREQLELEKAIYKCIKELGGCSDVERLIARTSSRICSTLFQLHSSESSS